VRYKIELCYKGTNYSGWQRQPNAQTVQQVLEDSLNLIFRDNVEITGCGRTDAGVHAKYYIAHFDSEKNYNLISVKKLNNYLPIDIAIFDITPASEDFHARFSAKSRTYEYILSTKKNPFDYGLSLYLPKPLKLDLMNEALLKLFDYCDFTSFSKLHTDVKTNNCKILNAGIKTQDDKIIIYITADRFLRNMVRAIVGTLIEVGRGKLNISDFCEIIESRNRGNAGKSVPSDGLFLVNVEY
jgi:tRNA pseudouridine38-40 synthase